MKHLALWAALGCTLAATAVSAQTVLKMGHATSTNSHYQTGSQAFADEVEKRTNGRYKVQIFAASALGGEREMIEATQLGTLDLVNTSTGPVGNFVPETLIVDIPFLFRDYDHARKTLDGAIGEDILSKFPGKGMIALAWAENGFRHMTNNKKAINLPEDTKGLKIRTMENRVHMDAFKSIGLLPTPMAFPELFTALQQGTVDGQENPIPVILASKFSQVQKHLTLTNHVYSPALIIMSKSVHDKLSDADKAAFREAGRIAAAAQRKRVNEDERTGVETLRAAGMQVITTVDSGKWAAAMTPVYGEFAKRFGADKIKAIQDVK
jgi:TRAP-type transport system periplasmic protein